MYKIPGNSRRFTQTNQSDLFGNISFTKSINFDEDGYLKMSPRSVSLINSEDDTDFNIPVSFGRYSTGDFYLATTENPYILDLNDGSSDLIKDTDTGGATPPTLAFNTYGKWWQGRWHVTTDTKLYYKTVSNGDWTDTSITALTTIVSHPIEVFEKANTLMVGNGNLVRQYNTSYSVASLAQLTISSDYEVIGLTYNNNYMGIATKLAPTVDGENKEAQFLTWDGSASSANASYGVGSDMIIGLVSYRSSYVILTRTGELKYFNGGGFDTLASFPVYFKNLEWADYINKLGYGDIMKVEGENIYINIQNIVTDRELNSQLDIMPAGIWCYDPAVGLYHRQSPSITQFTILSCQDTGVDTTNNKITLYTPNGFPSTQTIPETGNPIRCVSSTIGGLTMGDMYYIIKSSDTEFKLASSYDNALAFIPVDLTSAGGSFSYFSTLDIKDFGIFEAPRTGGVSLMGNIKYNYDSFIFGGDYYDSNSTSQYAHLNISLPKFKNISYFGTSKVMSSNVEDNIQKLYIKYRPLANDDKIELKYKNKDIYGLPEYASCTATSNTVFTTTANIGHAYATTEELECEILSGAGAGQMSKISSIAYNAGTYTITLEDEMLGVVASDIVSIKIDNWKILDTITSDDSLDWKEIPVAKVSKWNKFKIILSGSEVTIEELQIINKTQLE